MLAKYLGFLVLLLAGAAAGVAEARELALVIGNERYDTAEDLEDGADVVPAARSLARAGVEVTVLRNGTRAETLDAVAEFLREAPSADGLLVVLSGRFLSTATDIYLLPVDADAPPLAELPARTLPVSLVLAALAESEGPALLLVASEPEDTEFGRYVEAGVAGLRPIPGVPIVATTPRVAADIVEDTLSEPGRRLRPAVERRYGTRIIGELPAGFALIAEPAPRAAREAELWDTARRRDSAASYRDYLDVFPDGAHALEARLRIEAIRNDPIVSARASETALGLGAGERRQIQRDLSLLDYSTRGIDGIFGHGTRSAISGWQADNGLTVTGYLDRNQIDRLDGQAAARRAELERADSAWWDQTGAHGGAANLRAYLERYPDGRHAEIARNRLEWIEGEKRANAAAAERAAWDRANREDTVASYQSYLDRYPNGAFREEATARRDSLRGNRQDARELAAAEAEEARLGLNRVTARVVEGRLDALGLNPGPVDGTFDAETRRALRRYQQERGLPATGYVNEATTVRLLADSIGAILRE